MTPRGRRAFNRLYEAASAIKRRSKGRLDDLTAWQLAETQLAKRTPADIFQEGITTHEHHAAAHR